MPKSHPEIEQELFSSQTKKKECLLDFFSESIQPSNLEAKIKDDLMLSSLREKYTRISELKFIKEIFY